eukprot:196138-Pleurochrysis_carterae.AAC.1
MIDGAVLRMLESYPVRELRACWWLVGMMGKGYFASDDSFKQLCVYVCSKDWSAAFSLLVE